jgi:hypothetical protein
MTFVGQDCHLVLHHLLRNHYLGFYQRKDTERNDARMKTLRFCIRKFFYFSESQGSMRGSGKGSGFQSSKGVSCGSRFLS